MAEFMRRGGRFFCPGCDKYIGGDWGPINGARLCDSCVVADKGVKKPKSDEKT